jgi:hypothetical protein
MEAATMGNIVDLRGRSIPIEDDALIEDLARYADGTLSMAAVKSRHHLNNAEWTALGENDELVEKIEARKLARIRSGATKAERAQIEVADAGPILGQIMRGPNSPRHVIDAVRALDSLAVGGAEAAAAGARFEITIVMNSDSSGDANHIEHYSKSIKSNPNDTDPNATSTTLELSAFTAIAAKKNEDGENGGHI